MTSPKRMQLSFQLAYKYSPPAPNWPFNWGHIYTVAMGEHVRNTKKGNLTWAAKTPVHPYTCTCTWLPSRHWLPVEIPFHMWYSGYVIIYLSLQLCCTVLHCSFARLLVWWHWMPQQHSPVGVCVCVCVCVCVRERERERERELAWRWTIIDEVYI